MLTEKNSYINKIISDFLSKKAYKKGSF